MFYVYNFRTNPHTPSDGVILGFGTGRFEGAYCDIVWVAEMPLWQEEHLVCCIGWFAVMWLITAKEGYLDCRGHPTDHLCWFLLSDEY